MKPEDFKSKEEFYFWHWLKELEDAGIIKNIETQCKFEDLTEEMYAFQLVQMKTKVKSVPRKILSSASYTADFGFTIIKENPFSIDVSSLNTTEDPRKFKGLFSMDDKCYVDTKGKFNDHNNERITKRSRMMVWTAHRQFINILRIPDFFFATFMPYRYTLTDKTMKPRKIDSPYKTIQSFEL